MYQIQFNNPVRVHFIGIGGVSMSALALILKKRGFIVTGSDMRKTELTESLKSEGISVSYGHSASNIDAKTGFAVYTSAVKQDNPEIIACKKLHVPLLVRAELLGQIMKLYDTSIAVSGTHGKTTTTSMVSEILLDTGKNPTLTIGGFLPSIGGNVRLGDYDYFVAEACEYTNSFLSFYPNVEIVLNIEEDHLDFFKDIDDIRHSFKEFTKKLSKDDILIINGSIDNLDYFTKDIACRYKTFGFDKSFDYYPGDTEYNDNACAAFTVQKKSGSGATSLFRLSLSVPGEHNILNALAAAACCDSIGIPSENIVRSLCRYSGTKRRFEFKGLLGKIKVYDDYAHHPDEITATIKTAKRLPHGKIWCVFQPHTYTRTKALFPEFVRALSGADEVVLADIYAARETDTLGVSSGFLCDALHKSGASAHYFPSFSEIEDFLIENASQDDIILTMGAGDVYKISDFLTGSKS